MGEQLLTGDRDNLTRAMNERRRELDQKWNQILPRTGLSDATLRHVRTQPDRTVITETTARGIERGLLWAKGSVQRVLNGKPPIEDDTTIGGTDTGQAIQSAVSSAHMDRLVWLSERIADRATYYRIVMMLGDSYDEGFADGVAKGAETDDKQAS